VITDKVFPNLALNHLGVFAGLVFIIGLTAATFSSADSVLTTLTTSAYIDILELEDNKKLSDLKKKQYRTAIHVGFAILLWIIIIGFDLMNKTAIISTILMLAGYTYGPLLALFAAGLFTKLNFKDKWVPLACVMGPLVCYYVKESTLNYPTGYQIGNELILVNGIITFAGANERKWFISKDYGRWYESANEYFRTPNHISPVKRDIAIQVKFPSINQSEDFSYSMDILPYLKYEVKIIPPMYHYKFGTVMPPPIYESDGSPYRKPFR
jgi:hypothetical protein